MANHARNSDSDGKSSGNSSARSVADKRAALAGGGTAGKRSALASAQRNAYNHGNQVGGTRRREADGRWVDRTPEDTMPVTPPREKGPVSVGAFVRNNAVYILSVAAVVIIVVLLVVGVRMVSGMFAPQRGVQSENAPIIDWSHLDYTNDRYTYVVDGQVKSRLGIDVADYQNEIDWDAVAADGIDFAIIRLGYRGATEGELYIDERFEDNLFGAKQAGLDCGVYFFSQAITPDEAREEAEFVLSALGGTRLEYPIAFDSEEVTSLGVTRTSDLSDEEMTAIADAFCDRIEAAGYHTMVYGNALDLSSYDVDILTGRGIWWAEYDVDQPSHDIDIVIWQYTSSGEVAGIETYVDMNIDVSAV